MYKFLHLTCNTKSTLDLKIIKKKQLEVIFFFSMEEKSLQVYVVWRWGGVRIENMSTLHLSAPKFWCFLLVLRDKEELLINILHDTIIVSYSLSRSCFSGYHCQTFHALYMENNPKYRLFYWCGSMGHFPAAQFSEAHLVPLDLF